MMRIYDNGIYRDATPEEMKALALTPTEEIEQCKAQLSATDYQAIKHSEGLISEDDYAPIKAQRQALRDRINALEERLREGK